MCKTLIALVVSLSFVFLSAGADPPAQEAVEAPPSTLKEGQWYRASVAIDAVQEIPFLLWLPRDDGEGIIRTGAQDQKFPFKKLEGWMRLEFGPMHELRTGGQMSCDISAVPRPDGGLDGYWNPVIQGETQRFRFRANQIPQPDATLLAEQPGWPRMEDDEARWPSWGAFESQEFTPQFELKFDKKRDGSFQSRAFSEEVVFRGFAGPIVLTPVEAIIDMQDRQIHLTGIHRFYSRSGFSPSASYQLSMFDGESAVLLTMGNQESGIGDFVGELQVVGHDTVSIQAIPTEERRLKTELAD